MICDTFLSQVEYHDKMQALIYPDESEKYISSDDYLSRKANEFCDLTGVKPYELFKRSRKEHYVAIKVAFVQFLGDYSPFRIGKFLGYNHSSVYNWIEKHEEYKQIARYRLLLRKIEDNTTV